MIERAADAIDFLNDGVAILGREGAVLYANSSANQLLDCGTDGVLPEASPVRRAMASAGKGIAALPASLSLSGAQPDGTPLYAEARLLPLRGAELVLFLARNQTQAMLYANLLHNVVEMLHRNLRQPCEALAHAVGRAEAALADGKTDIDLLKEAAARAAVLEEGSESLIDLAHLLGHFPTVGNERIAASDLYCQISDRVARIAHELGIAFDRAEAPKDLPTLYGSSRWLLRAIEEHLVAVLGEEPEAHGISGRVAATSEGFLIAFALHGGRWPPSAPSESNARAASKGLLSPELAMDRHILDLHGGRARLNDAPGGASGMELTFHFGQTGRREEPALGAEQVQRYARDIARLYRSNIAKA